MSFGKGTRNISEDPTASTYALKTEAAGYFKTIVPTNKLYGIIAQKL
jgi:hypothetical protein